MRLWHRASGLLKDQNSLWQANLSRRTALRNPDIEKAVIRATNHHDSSLDRHNIDRVCQWLRLSPSNLKPILWSISHRMERTRSWVVALKGLHLMHIISNARAPCVRKIGRIPFDLSGFTDGHSRRAKSWPFDAFVRAYFAFLDHKSTVVFKVAEYSSSDEVSIAKELAILGKLQSLIDLLMQIKPQSRAAFAPLVLHVMDGVIVEIYDLYSRICRGIAIILMNIYSAGKMEAVMALNIVKKASQQGEDLTSYFEFCQEIGVVNASEFPIIDRIPDEGIRELEQIIEGFTDGSKVGELKENKTAIVVRDQEVAQSGANGGKFNYRDDLKTVITDNWERFEEDLGPKNPFASPIATNRVIQEPPDLISFL